MPAALLLTLTLAAVTPAETVDPQHGADAAFVYRTADSPKTGGAVDLKLHLFLPEGGGFLPEGGGDRPAGAARPGVIFYFGGGWRGGAAGQFAPHARHFAGRGLVAAVAEYRVNSRDGTGPVECLRDARAALHALRERAEDYRLDPARLAAGGGSAGGHLAACCGTIAAFPGDPKGFETADALLLFNPGLIAAPYTAPGGETAGPDRWMTGLLREGGDERLSPIHHLDAEDPPAIVFHGAEDTTVPPRSVELYRDAAAAKGVRCELTLYPGAGHGFFNKNRGGDRAYDDTLRRADAFLVLVSLGWLGEDRGGVEPGAGRPAAGVSNVSPSAPAPSGVGPPVDNRNAPPPAAAASTVASIFRAGLPSAVKTARFNGTHPPAAVFINPGPNAARRRIPALAPFRRKSSTKL